LTADVEVSMMTWGKHVSPTLITQAKAFLVVFFGLFSRIDRPTAVGSKCDHQFTPDYETFSSAAGYRTGSMHFLRLRLISSQPIRKFA
jgi:hypothetical protein